LPSGPKTKPRSAGGHVQHHLAQALAALVAIVSQEIAQRRIGRVRQGARVDVAERDEPVGVALGHLEDFLVGLGKVDLRTDDREERPPLYCGLVVPLDHLLGGAELNQYGRVLSIRVGVNVNEHLGFPYA